MQQEEQRVQHQALGEEEEPSYLSLQHMIHDNTTILKGLTRRLNSSSSRSGRFGHRQRLGDGRSSSRQRTGRSRLHLRSSRSVQSQFADTGRSGSRSGGSSGRSRIGDGRRRESGYRRRGGGGQRGRSRGGQRRRSRDGSSWWSSSSSLREHKRQKNDTEHKKNK